MTKQQPLGTGNNWRTTAAEVIQGIDLTGKTAIVTGGYAGIGLETVKTLKAAGAEVWVPARDMVKARAQTPEAILHPMDLIDPSSVDAFAAAFLTTGKPLDLLINNAGIMFAPLRRDARGNESHLATNHLGHFRLTARLWPALRASGAARVVTVSSFAHAFAPFDFEDPNFIGRPYDMMLAYGQSKTANNLFTVELDRRGVRALALHPGAVYGTELSREAPVELFQQMGQFGPDGKILPDVEKKLKTVPQGAATTVWCATSPALNDLGGVYCEDGDVAVLDEGDIAYRFDEPSTLRGVKPYSLDPAGAQRLWAWSESVTGLEFPVN
ncbi:MAG TPA: SDR family NAD(P)-dependent oxidoreductase [Dinghuibacter sp.]|uniref:SDR family NAD(P)-dependent oxidoreductase n=1 Tax=Dinghuibacter sp. TaxID=2024697 RepID=UPI002CA60484|nr:SDR family NAD(P)-dependent oxidoreductase [Dinghuibacter sp.]HTJ13344.1 SDR family NAD(P)-dependent oxidoreductase [Dinghuibacter sp.]